MMSLSSPKKKIRSEPIVFEDYEGLDDADDSSYAADEDSDVQGIVDALAMRPYEPLLLELQDTLRQRKSEKKIDHPLLVTKSYFSDLNRHYNRVYLNRLQAVRKAYDSRDWFVYLSLHHRKHRFDAIDRLLYDSGVDHTGRLELLRAAWLMLQVGDADRDGLLRLVANYSGRVAMNVIELALLGTLPEKFDVVRGACLESEGVDAPHWLSYSNASRDARRIAALRKSEPIIIRETVEKNDVFGLLADEDQIQVVCGRTTFVKAIDEPYV